MSSYTVAISSDDPSAPSMTALVRLGEQGPVVQEVSVRLGGAGTALPDDLAAIDFAELVRIAATLSEGRLPSPPVPATPATPADPPSPAAQPAPSVRPAPDAASRPAPGAGVPPDLAVVYWRLGSAAKVAAHYSVPRQIATDWIRLLRKQGAAPNPWQRTRRAGGGRNG